MDARPLGDLSLGDALHLHRRHARIKNRELAERLGIKEATLHRLLADNVNRIDLSLGRRLSETLGVSMIEVEEMHQAGLRKAERIPAVTIR